jgi:two-component system sensor histidine kinase YesM
MIVNLYKKIFGHKFFNKVFLTYASLTVCAIIVIAYMTVLNINTSIKNRETKNNNKVLSSINARFEQKIAASRSIAVNIYTNSAINSEIVYLAKNGYNKHLEYKYNKLLSSIESKYNGFESYFDSCLYSDKDILGIGIYSNTQPNAFVYSNSGLGIHNKDYTVANYIERHSAKEQGILVIPYHPVNYLDSDGSKAFTVIYQVKDTLSPDIAGYIAIDYSLDSIKDEFSEYSNDYKGNVLIFNEQGDIIYDSSNLYPENTILYSTLKNNQSNSYFYQNNVIDSYISSDSGTLAAAILPKKHIEDLVKVSSRTIYLISFACIALTILLTLIIIKTFSKRIDSLMNGIKCIDSGNLSSRITVENKRDEISEIAESFNKMCDHLNTYIEKVYISDIKQKQAQLKALQAQINPHFLYNTLESIRMRALVNGSKDVAQMIYLLSSLFRNSIKEKTFISIGEEIKYCKMYLELFNMRFSDNIKVTFDINEEAINYGIAKHSIQPLIENYILHGIDTERGDNSLIIRAFKNEGDIYIYVIDNGCGIPQEKLELIRQNLKSPSSENGSGLGLINVNERIMLLFGSNYGIDIYSELEKGSVVMLKLPAKTSEEMDISVQNDNSR